MLKTDFVTLRNNGSRGRIIQSIKRVGTMVKRKITGVRICLKI